MTMTTNRSPAGLPDWHSTFAAGCTDITLDLAGVDSVDHAAAWCIADTRSALVGRNGRLTIANASDAVQAAMAPHGPDHQPCSLPAGVPGPTRFRKDPAPSRHRESQTTPWR